LIRRCLEKDRSRRLQHIGEARITIDEALHAPAAEEAAIVSPVRSARLAWAVAALFAIAFVVALVLLLRPSPIAPQMRLELVTPPTADPFSLAISPDGRKVAFVATSDSRSRLWLRSLDSDSAEPLAQTEGASSPFWSPDNRSIGFLAEGKLKRLDLASGAVQVVTAASSSRGGTWNPDGTILFAAGAIFRVPASGGQAVRVTNQRLEQARPVFPYVLPDGHHFLFTVPSGSGNRGSTFQIYVAAIDGGEPRHLLDADSATVSASSGHLLFSRQATLFAQKLDAKNLRLIGDPVAVAKEILFNPGIGVSAFSTSRNGLVVYRTGRIPEAGRREYVWFDRSGKQLGTIGEPNMGSNPVLSPDGRRLAMQSTRAGGNTDIWLFDILRNVLTRFTFDPAGEYNPIWSPDGSRIAFGSTRGNALNLYVKPATGVGAEELLFQSDRGLIAQDWSRDGQFILYLRGDEKANFDTGSDLWALPLTGDRKPFPVAQAKFDERDGQFSPDSKWVAYASNESGQSQIYIQPFPKATSKSQVSVNGGFQPRWRPDGKEMFYLRPDGELMAVPLKYAQDSQQLEPGNPLPLFMTTVPGGVEQSILNRQQYVVSPDGQRFLIGTGIQESVTLPITVLLNWKGVN